MKFKLSTVGNLYSDEQEMQRLEKLGFAFERNEKVVLWKDVEWGYRIDGTPQIEINTLEELMEFIGIYGKIVMEADEITIYDDWI